MSKTTLNYQLWFQDIRFNNIKKIREKIIEKCKKKERNNEWFFKYYVDTHIELTVLIRKMKIFELIIKYQSLK